MKNLLVAGYKARRPSFYLVAGVTADRCIYNIDLCCILQKISTVFRQSALILLLSKSKTIIRNTPAPSDDEVLRDRLLPMELHQIRNILDKFTWKSLN